MLTFEVVYALWYLRRIKSELLPDIAVAMLADGYETPSLQQLAGMEPYNERAVQELFSQVINELRLPPLNPLAATILVGKYLASEMLNHDKKAKVCATQKRVPKFEESQNDKPKKNLSSGYNCNNLQERIAILERELFIAAREAIKIGV
jgi:hypothetical protein